MIAALNLDPLALDLEQARRIQRSFLPTIPPRIGPLQLVAEYRPAMAVGGDFYHIAEREDGQVLLTLGDAVGHGVSGALWMARGTLELHRLAHHAEGPLALLRGLHRSLAPEMCDDAFFTVVCVALDVRGRRLRIANAGHLSPLLRHASGPVAPSANAGAPHRGQPSSALPRGAVQSDARRPAAAGHGRRHRRSEQPASIRSD